MKNRPSTLLEAYSTLDQLDALFRYHRRLGLSPGEFRAIQDSGQVTRRPYEWLVGECDAWMDLR